MGTFNRMACATVAWAFLLVAGLSVTSEAQYANIVFNRLGQPMAGAKVAICTSDPGSTTPPCASLATTYTTISYGTACVAPAETGPMSGTGCGNPGLTDAYGNYILYANSAILYAQVYGTGITTQVFPFVIGTTATNFVDLISNQSITGTKTFTKQIISTLATGTAPFAITSITPVANLTLLADTQLPTISTAGKVADTALSSNVALYNNGSKTWCAGASCTWTINAGDANTFTIIPSVASAGIGSSVVLQGGEGATGQIGGTITLQAGTGGTGVNGGTTQIKGGAGRAPNGNGGDIKITNGIRAGAGSPGRIQIQPPVAGTPNVADSNAFAIYSSAGKAQISENAGAYGNLSAPAIINGACTGTATSSVTRGLYLLGQTTSITCTNAYTNVATPVSTRSGNVQNLRVKCGTGGFNASSGAFTVMIDGSASSVSGTTGTGTTASDTTHQAAITAGQTYSVQFTTQATETLANCSASFEIQ